MIGQLRHSMFEQELRALGRRGDVPLLTALDEQLRSSRGCIKPGSYVAVNYGSIIITQSHTDKADDLPPEALFRKTKARVNQWTLEESTDGTGPQRYIVLTHGPSESNPEEIGFVQAGFLHPAGHKYIYKYDLMDLPIDKIMGLDRKDTDIEIDITIIEDDKEEGEEE